MASLSEITDDRIERHGASLESVVAPWPIAACICQHLPVGDLISLARTNIALRASLHGFGYVGLNADVGSTGSVLEPKSVREHLNIGFHDTLYWSRLKDLSPFKCASIRHTKGDSPRPCRFCSRPICEACIVKDSFIHPKENTFNNRCVSMCPECWDSGNISRSRRFPLASSRRHQGWYGNDDAADEVCTCTLKKDAYLCIPCKNLQNNQAVSESAKQCHGYECNNPAGEDARRRRICTWCHKPLPGHRGGAARLEWNQKIIDARKMAAESRQADLLEYNIRRLKLLRMSRRELRGNEAVKDDLNADLPQYVRHLDTFNYRRFMPDSAAPTGNEVYLSKKGFWVYSQDFLKQIGRFCKRLPPRQELTHATRAGASTFARTNAERRVERNQYRHIRNELEDQLDGVVRQPQIEEWYNMKPTILEMLAEEQPSIRELQSRLLLQHRVTIDLSELEFILIYWGYPSTKEHSQRRAEPEQSIFNKEAENDDLHFAIELQEQLDRDAAEALQYSLFDDALSEDNQSARASQHSSTDRSEAGPQHDTMSDADDEEDTERPVTSLQPEATLGHNLRDFGALTVQPPDDSPPLATGSGDRSSASLSQDMHTAHLPASDDPPPYNPSGSW